MWDLENFQKSSNLPQNAEIVQDNLPFFRLKLCMQPHDVIFYLSKQRYADTYHDDVSCIVYKSLSNA